MAGRRFSRRAYQRLLAACPGEFRREHGPQMEQAFGDLCREERYGGAAGLVKLWLRAFPDLAMTVVAERSKTMGQAALQVGRLVSLKSLMILNAVFLILFGLMAMNAGPAIAELYELGARPYDDPGEPIANAGGAFARFAGVALLGFGAMMMLLVPSAEGRAKAISGTLFAVYGFGFLLMLVQQTQIWFSAVGWATVAAHLLFALGYGLFLVSNIVEDWRPSQNSSSVQQFRYTEQ